MNRASPIVVLDSGLGGLTVVRALARTLPDEQLLYFGDTARLPYGSKTPAVVTAFVSQIIRYLLPLGPKHVVIACNTATAVALPELVQTFPGLSISGVISPAADAVAATTSRTVGVIATEATVRSGAYPAALAARVPGANVLMAATPLLVPIIEDGRTEEDPLVQIALEQYLSPLVSGGIDVLVLGCTHYPILRGAIERTLERLSPRPIAVIDSAAHCARDVADRLSAKGLRHPAAGESDGLKLRTWVTDDPARFARLGSRFLGCEMALPVWVSPDDLPRATPGIDASRLVLRRAV